MSPDQELLSEGLSSDELGPDGTGSGELLSWGLGPDETLELAPDESLEMALVSAALLFGWIFVTLFSPVLTVLGLGFGCPLTLFFTDFSLSYVVIG